VLDLCREISGGEPAAAGALARWQAWQDATGADCPRSESRFRRRAYERAREGAMPVLVMVLARERRRTPRRPDPGVRRRRTAAPTRHRVGGIG